MQQQQQQKTVNNDDDDDEKTETATTASGVSCILNKTADENATEMLHLLQDYLLDVSKVGDYLEKMATEYVVINDLEELQEGRYIRWIREGVMMRGGVILSKDAEKVVCKTAFNQLVQFRFDECPCFMKMNVYEQWYLLNA
jgi:hypothetical protein